MDILVCDDEPMTLRLVETLVQTMGHKPVCKTDGRSGLLALTSPHPPRLAIIDWEMPDLSGIEICKTIRQQRHLNHIYLILLTGRRATGDIVEGLEAGANDYVTKPFDSAELRARVRIGLRTLQLQDEIRVLSGLLPICAWCNKIRDEQAHWVKIEQYVANHSDAQFTHGICPSCRSQVAAKEGLV